MYRISIDKRTFIVIIQVLSYDHSLPQTQLDIVNLVKIQSLSPVIHTVVVQNSIRTIVIAAMSSRAAPELF
jgi:pyruvoyl-dependent arginine decarboxylase (PvlArgDC)